MEAMEEEQLWQASNGGPDINDIFNDEELQEIEDHPLADLDDAHLAVEDEDNDDQAPNTVLGKGGQPKWGEL